MRTRSLLILVLMVLLTPSLAAADWFDDLGAELGTALAAGSFGLALGIAFLGGLATSLTPCVYPMIVITVSVFGARQATSRGQAAMLSTVFVLGMATLFTPLGIAAAMAGDGLHGGALSNPWLLFGLATFFILLSLAMFGAYELNLPPALQNRLAQAGGAGYGGAFVLGLVSGVIAAPCTGPVLLALLGWVGTTGDMFFGGLALFVYALGLGLLFWLVGTFAVSLPKSGRWLEWVKSVFGVVMIVVAFYYIRDFLPDIFPAERSFGFIGGTAMVALLGVALGAIHLSFHEPAFGVRLRKGLGIALAVVGLFGVVSWAEAVPPGAKITWLEDYDHAKALASRESRPLLVDFGASWCGACGELDRHTFSDPRVVAAAQDFVPVRIDLSPGQDTPDKRAVLAGYEQRGLPLVVLHDREGQEVARVTKFVDADEFLSIIRRVN